ncbi:tyrosine-type recombinase/integrase [Priestia sp. SB1]|uniref:tyrosine-type recombinase/integrase n=1 Tax=Priestia sp. SB1 TaxID=3132359 RepID=UPI00316CD159
MSDKLPEVTEKEWEEVNDFNRQIVSEFLEQGHLSPHTLRQYQSGLKIFFRWVKENCMNKPITDLKPRDALRYQNFLIGRDLSSSAIKFKRSAVSSLCGYIELYYAEDYPLFRNIYNKKIPNPPKTLKNEKKPLTPQEFDLLVKTLEEREEWQMLAYVWFSYSTGCRRSESVQLLKEVIAYNRVKDKDGNDKAYYITHNIRCKGRGREGKVRKLNFDDRAMDAIKKWLEVRDEDECEYVFVKKTKKGEVNQLSTSSLNYWCQEIFSDIVGRRVHPHQLRSTRATHLVALDGKDIKSAQKLLGHESSETTELYVIKEGDDDIDGAF